MFTSRAEYRLILREDNADLRLTTIGRELGLVSEQRWNVFTQKRDAVLAEQQRLQDILVRPQSLTATDHEIAGGDLQKECRAAELLRRPELSYADITALSVVGAGDWRKDMAEERIAEVELQLEVQARYAGYIERQQREIEKHAKQENLKLPPDIDYAAVTGLSTEARQRLQNAQPETIGSRVAPGRRHSLNRFLAAYSPEETLPASALRSRQRRRVWRAPRRASSGQKC